MVTSGAANMRRLSMGGFPVRYAATQCRWYRLQTRQHCYPASYSLHSRPPHARHAHATSRVEQRRCRSATSSGNEAIEDVLIVGAGPVGVYLSILLARMGVTSVVIEKTGTSLGTSDDERRTHPRAHVLHTRSMELLSEIGLFDEIQREMPPLEQWKYFRYCASLVSAARRVEILTSYCR